jgi:hypothetical protein
MDAKAIRQRWRRAVDNVIASGDPTLAFALEEAVIAEMASCAEKGKMAEVDMLRDVISSDDLLVDERTQPFLEAGKQRIRGAAETLRALKAGRAPKKAIGELIPELEHEKDPEKKLVIAGKIGSRILQGEDLTFTYAIEDETSRNWLMGAKTLRALMAQHPHKSII